MDDVLLFWEPLASAAHDEHAAETGRQQSTYSFIQVLGLADVEYQKGSDLEDLW